MFLQGFVSHSVFQASLKSEMKKMQTKEADILNQVKKLTEKKHGVQVCLVVLTCRDLSYLNGDICRHHFRERETRRKKKT